MRTWSLYQMALEVRRSVIVGAGADVVDGGNADVDSGGDVVAMAVARAAWCGFCCA